MQEKLVRQGMVTLMGSGIELVKKGMTTLEEVLRVTVNE
jgi:type II secretory ATPase GspE/PulE/Tfp pilus assembly ATPase PilB-like protein